MEVTEQNQSFLVLHDEDLPWDLKHLVPTSLSFFDGPDFFSTAKWQWIELPFAEYPTFNPQLAFTSGTRLFDSEDEAATQFAAGVIEAETGAPNHDQWEDVSTFTVPLLGDEVIGIRLKGNTSAILPYQTQVVFRRGAVLAYVSISRTQQSPDDDIAISLAGTVASNIQDVMSGSATGETDHGSVGQAIGAATIPQRQLNTFAFDALISWEMEGDAQAYAVSGEFTGSHLLRCDVSGNPDGDEYRFVSDENGVALDTDDGWQYLSSDDPRMRLAAMCPGMYDFFQNRFLVSSTWASVILTFVGRTTEFGREAFVYEGSDINMTSEGFPYYGQVEDIVVAFDESGGWPVYMLLQTQVDADRLFIPGPGGGGPANLIVEFVISRANDPTIDVQMPQIASP